MRALEIVDLKKNYASVKALKGISFKVKEGEVVGLLGPNGAGKSTTLKILATLLKPSSGKVLLSGKDIWEDVFSYRASLGYVPENSELYPDMSGYEYLVFVGRLRGLDERELRKRAESFLELFGLAEKMYIPIRDYSRGMKQKVLLSSALLHRPEIILLDEPMAGLDSFSVFVVMELIKGLASAGKIVIYASHILELVEKVCSRVVIINRGEILADEKISRLKELQRSDSLADVFKELVLEQNPSEVASLILERVLEDG